MSHEPPDQVARQHLRALIQANFVGRDDLYAAADAIDSQTLSMICRRLGDDLANNAIELQQIALAAGMDQVNMNDIGAGLQAELMEMLQQRCGDGAVLEEAQECEKLVRQEYNQAIEQTGGQQVEELLRHQREAVEFGENVVRNLRSSGTGEAQAELDDSADS